MTGVGELGTGTKAWNNTVRNSNEETASYETGYSEAELQQAASNGYGFHPTFHRQAEPEEVEEALIEEDGSTVDYEDLIPTLRRLSRSHSIARSREDSESPNTFQTAPTHYSSRVPSYQSLSFHDEPVTEEPPSTVAFGNAHVDNDNGNDIGKTKRSQSFIMGFDSSPVPSEPTTPRSNDHPPVVHIDFNSLALEADAGKNLQSYSIRPSVMKSAKNKSAMSAKTQRKSVTSVKKSDTSPSKSRQNSTVTLTKTSQSPQKSRVISPRRSQPQTKPTQQRSPQSIIRSPPGATRQRQAAAVTLRSDRSISPRVRRPDQQYTPTTNRAVSPRSVPRTGSPPGARPVRQMSPRRYSETKVCVVSLEEYAKSPRNPPVPPVESILRSPVVNAPTRPHTARPRIQSTSSHDHLPVTTPRGSPADTGIRVQVQYQEEPEPDPYVDPVPPDAIYRADTRKIRGRPSMKFSGANEVRKTSGNMPVATYVLSPSQIIRTDGRVEEGRISPTPYHHLSRSSGAPPSRVSPQRAVSPSQSRVVVVPRSASPRRAVSPRRSRPETAPVIRSKSPTRTKSPNRAKSPNRGSSPVYEGHLGRFASPPPASRRSNYVGNPYQDPISIEKVLRPSILRKPKNRPQFSTPKYAEIPREVEDQTFEPLRSRTAVPMSDEYHDPMPSLLNILRPDILKKPEGKPGHFVAPRNPVSWPDDGTQVNSGTIAPAAFTLTRKSPASISPTSTSKQ